jgi:hypothetical protein
VEAAEERESEAGEMSSHVCGCCGIFEWDASNRSQLDVGEDAGGDEHAGPTTSGDYPDAVDLDAWDPSIWVRQGTQRARQAAEDPSAVSDLDDGEISLTAQPARRVENFLVFCTEDPSSFPRRAWEPSLAQQQLLEARYSTPICRDAVIALGQHGTGSPATAGTSAAAISSPAESELEVIDISSSDAVGLNQEV